MRNSSLLFLYCLLIPSVSQALSTEEMKQIVLKDVQPLHLGIHGQECKAEITELKTLLANGNTFYLLVKARREPSQIDCVPEVDCRIWITFRDLDDRDTKYSCW